MKMLHVVLPTLCIIRNILYLIFLSKVFWPEILDHYQDLANSFSLTLKCAVQKALSQQAKKPELLGF